MKLKLLVPAFLWLIFSTILFTLPGDDLPKADLFNIPYFDKYVHMGLFFVLTVLLLLPVNQNGVPPTFARTWVISIIIGVVLYGIAIEFVQKLWVRGRSYDLSDVVADTAGCSFALAGTFLFFHKKIGPDGNQGRNQN